MMLAIPAKLGVPYEIGLKSVNLACAMLMIWLLEFKTKLPELFKAILPFSYFLCYQYGVTSRPYALMICAMLLIAINWKNRDEKPLPVILSMMLLCLTSSYGIVISGMLAVNWVFRFLKSDHSLIRNKRRFFALLALLAFAVILIIDVIPAKDVFHSNFDVQGTEEPVPVWQRFLNAWILLPSETLFTSILTNSSFNFVTLSWDQVLEAGLFSGADVGVPHPDQPTQEQCDTTADHVFGDEHRVHTALLHAPRRHHTGILHSDSGHRLRDTAHQRR